MYEKIATMTAQDASEASNEHWRVEQDVVKLMSRLTLAQKKELLEKVQDFCAKAAS